jgi:hypothetical protein
MMKKISFTGNDLTVTLCYESGVLKEVSLSLTSRNRHQAKAGRNEERVLGLIKNISAAGKMISPAFRWIFPDTPKKKRKSFLL